MMAALLLFLTQMLQMTPATTTTTCRNWHGATTVIAIVIIDASCSSLWGIETCGCSGLGSSTSAVVSF